MASRTLLDELEDALKRELIQINAPGTVEKPAASLTDKMKVFDRILKLVALKHDIKDQKFGSGFQDDDTDA